MKATSRSIPTFDLPFALGMDDDKVPAFPSLETPPLQPPIRLQVRGRRIGWRRSSRQWPWWVMAKVERDHKGGWKRRFGSFLGPLRADFLGNMLKRWYGSYAI